MGASCVSQFQKDDDELAVNTDDANPSKKDLLEPTSPISAMFEAMCEDIGYDMNSLQSFSDKLASLWIYRVVDLLLLDDAAWEELGIPSVLEHVIRDYLHELEHTDSFTNYRRQSETDIFVCFINKDIRLIFDSLSSSHSIAHLESARQHIDYLRQYLGDRYLFNIKMLKKYMTKQEWDELAVPTNLKAIICRKIKLEFNGEQCDGAEQDIKISSIVEEAAESKSEEGDEDDDMLISPLMGPTDVRPGLHNMSSLISQQIVAAEASDDDKDDHDAIWLAHQGLSALNEHCNAFDEECNGMSVRMTMKELATHFAAELFADLDAVYEHFVYFREYGYRRLYHLSFIPEPLFEKLLSIKKTPRCLVEELSSLVDAVRRQYADSMNNLRHIMPFKSEDCVQNVYWEKNTVDAIAMLQDDIGLDLSRECAILMERFYANLWDWQFMSDALLKQLNGFQKYEIVRIRMQHILKLCQFQYGQYGSNVPLLPPLWKSQFDGEVVIDEMLRSTKGLHLDGLEWSESTIRKRDLLHDFLDENFVRKLWTLPIEHRKDDEEWTELFTTNEIGEHLRFKLNFFAVHGLPGSDDCWLNVYIQRNYKKVLPQYPQSTDIEIITGSAKTLYLEVERKVISIERMLHSIHQFNTMDKEALSQSESAQQNVFEMSNMIRSTIKEIDDLALNEQLADIIRFCGTKVLRRLKGSKFSLLVYSNMDLSKFDDVKCSQLEDIQLLLLEMKEKVDAIPIEDVMALSDTVTQSVRWLTKELKRSRHKRKTAH